VHATVVPNGQAQQLASILATEVYGIGVDEGQVSGECLEQVKFELAFTALQEWMRARWVVGVQDK
jgi:hypothetical protein